MEVNDVNTNSLTPAQVAFANRIGSVGGSVNGRLSDETLQYILRRSANDSDLRFDNFLALGGKLLDYFTKEYLLARFPQLHADGLKIGMQTFTSSGNLALLARFMGIEAALVDSNVSPPLSVGRCMKVPRWTKNSTRQLDPAKDAELEMKRKEAIELHASILKAFLGALSTEHGTLKVRKFLDVRHFSSAFPIERMCTPEYPIVDLTNHLIKLHNNSGIKVEFKLHQESGRLSNQSVYFVGAYGPSMQDQGKLSIRMLGEGYGASIALAQHRAATSALRNFYLKESPITSRPSDAFEMESHLNLN